MNISNNVNLLGPILKCFDTILKSPQPEIYIWPNPLKCFIQHPISHLGPLQENFSTIHKSKENSYGAHNPRCAYNTIIWAKTLLNGWRETAGAQVVISPKIQMVEYSQPVAPTKSEVKLTKDGDRKSHV